MPHGDMLAQTFANYVRKSSPRRCVGDLRRHISHRDHSDFSPHHIRSPKNQDADTRLESTSPVKDAIDVSACIIREEETAIRCGHYIYRASPHLTPLQPARGKVLRRAGLPIREMNSHYLVPRRHTAKNRAVQSYKQTAAILRREPGAAVKGKTQRGGMRLEVNQWLRYTIARVRSAELWVNNSACMTAGPAIVFTLLHDLDRVRRLVITEIVRAIVRCPQFIRSRTKRHAHRVAQTTRINRSRTAIGVEPHYRCAALIAFLANIAGRSNLDKKGGPIRTEEQGARRVILRSRQAVSHDVALLEQAVGIRVAEAEYLCWCRDIQRPILIEGETAGAVKILRHDFDSVGDAVLITVGKTDDASFAALGDIQFSIGSNGDVARRTQSARENGDAIACGQVDWSSRRDHTRGRGGRI